MGSGVGKGYLRSHHFVELLRVFFELEVQALFAVVLYVERRIADVRYFDDVARFDARKRKLAVHVGDGAVLRALYHHGSADDGAGLVVHDSFYRPCLLNGLYFVFSSITAGKAGSYSSTR